MEKDLPLQLDREILGQLATEQLVDMIIEQAIAIVQLKSRVIELELFMLKIGLLKSNFTTGLCDLELY
ncbi:hypothetical protein [Nostoc sp.]|uniref:hypothetical protein n=1 Tax=Nostoc sp. TaxID=1180 RepID=UPI002FF4A821